MKVYDIVSSDGKRKITTCTMISDALDKVNGHPMLRLQILPREVSWLTWLYYKVFLY